MSRKQPEKRRAHIGDWIVRTNHHLGAIPKGDTTGFQNEVSGTNFDELVLGGVGSCWFHMEQMDERTWWIGIGDAHIWVELDKTGKVKSVRGDKRTTETT